MAGGGGGYIPPISEHLQQMIEREREREKLRLDDFAAGSQ